MNIASTMVPSRLTFHGWMAVKWMARGVAMVAEGSVRPVIGMLRRLEQANEVLDALEAGRVVGRAVLERLQRGEIGERRLGGCGERDRARSCIRDAGVL